MESGAGELALAAKLGELIEQSFNQLYICSTTKSLKALTRLLNIIHKEIKAMCSSAGVGPTDDGGV